MLIMRMVSFMYRPMKAPTKSSKSKENPEVSIAVCGEWFTANGIGENLGWVLDPKMRN